jgi:hypothetical protein
MQERPAEELSLLDKAAALAEEAVRKQLEQKQAPLFALKGELLMSAAVIASRVAGVDAALDRVKAAASALDAAARADKNNTEVALNGAAAYALAATLEARRGNAEAAEEARAQGRRRLGALNPTQVSEGERLEPFPLFLNRGDSP